MRQYRRLALGAALLVLIGACSPGEGSKGTVKIGSVGFDEAKVMAEIYAQVLEADGYTVERSLGLGDRAVVAPAIESGQIDMQPEYIGSRLKYEGGNSTGDSDQNMAALQSALDAKGLTVLDYTPGIDTNAFVVRPETASDLNLSKMSDTAAVQDQLKWGLATDCPSNNLCGAPGGALQGQYGLTQATIDGATLLDSCSTAMADALRLGTIDVAELCSTQADILVNGWVILEDDKHTQPADNIAPVVRDDWLSRLSADQRQSFEAMLNQVSAKIETTTLQELNRQVAVDHRDPKDVATAWLKDNGFVD
jgi:osmoprotectant transport system substrate-binding protein